MFFEGLTCSRRGLTVSVAIRVWVPRPVSVLVNVMVALYVAAARPLALEFTVNVTVVPVDTVPGFGETLSQLGRLEME